METGQEPLLRFGHAAKNPYFYLWVIVQRLEHTRYSLLHKVLHDYRGLYPFGELPHSASFCKGINGVKANIKAFDGRNVAYPIQ